LKAAEDDVKQQLEDRQIQTNKMKNAQIALEQKATRNYEQLQKVRSLR